MRSWGEPTWGRKGAVAGVAFIGVLASAGPAFGHASIPSSAAFGFQPNPTGGTGAPGTSPPYKANTNVLIWVRAPDENEEPLPNGNPDVTVDVKVIVPAGWTSPTCGQA